MDSRDLFFAESAIFKHKQLQEDAETEKTFSKQESPCGKMHTWQMHYAFPHVSFFGRGGPGKGLLIICLDFK